MHLDFAKNSRTRNLAILTLVIMAVFVLRLFYLQVIRHEFYVSQAKSEQQKQFVLEPERGEIYAMDHDKPAKIVMNEAVYTVYVDPKVVEKPEKVVETIRRVAGGNARSNLEELVAKKDSRYQIVATQVTRKQAKAIKSENLYGVGFTLGTRRVYPEGQLAAQVLGFVDAEGQGRYGVEGALNDSLTGTPGLLQTVTDVREVPLTIGNDNIRRPAVNGQNTVLTIDRNIQAYAEKALATGLEKSGAKNGSVLIMNPQDGKIMAMANLPTYQPAEYNKVKDVGDFNNSTISLPYEVGSVAKTFTVATGIDQGAINAESTYNNTDSIEVDDRTIKNATKGQTGTITMQRALNYSLNTGMVTIAQRLGNGSEINNKARQTMYDYLYGRYRLGQKTGIELSGEAPGTIVAPNTTEGNAVRYSNMSFGQGMNLTMLQTASAFSAIINGGTYHVPSIVGGTVNEEGAFKPSDTKPSYPNVISVESSRQVRKMVHDARSTFYSNIDKKGYYTGGKTGTSQTLVNGIYTDDQTIGTYLGFGGSDANTPRYVVMVMVSGKNMNLEGGKHAMPIFTDISNWLCDYLKLQPKG